MNTWAALHGARETPNPVLLNRPAIRAVILSGEQSSVEEERRLRRNMLARASRRKKRLAGEGYGYRNNPESYRKAHRKWLAANRDRFNEIRRAHYWSHPEFREKHLAKCKAAYQARKATG